VGKVIVDMNIKTKNMLTVVALVVVVVVIYVLVVIRVTS